MLQIFQDGEQKSVGYTVENNMMPNSSQALNVMRKILFEEGHSRFDDSGATESFNSVCSYDPNFSTLLRHVQLNPHPLITGQMDLLDEEGNVVCGTSLFSPYSGDDTARGSLNRKESYDLTINNVIKQRVVVDIPSHAGNSAPIKKIRVKSRNDYQNIYFEDNKYEYGVTMFRSDRKNGILTCCLDDKGNLLTFESFGRMTYKGKIYEFDVTSEDFLWTNSVSTSYNYLYQIHYLDGKFYFYESYSTTNKLITLKPLVFNDIDNVVELGTPININLEQTFYTDRIYLNGLYKNKAGNYVICLGIHINSTYFYYVTLNPNWEVISEKRLGTFSNYGFYVLNHDFTANPDSEGKIEKRHYYNGTYYYTLFDYENLTITRTSNEGVYITTTGSYGTAIYQDGTYYYMNWGSNTNTGGYGTGNVKHVFKRTSNAKMKYPLIITLDEPIQKTKEQTLKVQLDVEINVNN